MRTGIEGGGEDRERERERAGIVNRMIYYIILELILDLDALNYFCSLSDSRRGPRSPLHPAA